VKALVTGAAGLVGSHLVDLLLERGTQPRALLRRNEVASFTRSNVEVRVGDVRDPTSLEDAIQGVDYVFHCAARTGPWGPEREYVDTNVRALETIVRLASAAGVRRLVHVSSITVHGNDVRGTANEASPLSVEPNPYSRSKVAGERVIERLLRQDHVPVTIVRPGWIYGPRDAASFGRFATLIRDGRMVVIGRGDNHIPLVYVTDVALGMVEAAECAAALGRTYLLVNDERVTQRAYLDAIADGLAVARPSRHIPYRAAVMLGAGLETAWRVSRRQTAPPLMRYGVQLLGGENCFSIAHARNDFGFLPNVTMAQGVKHSVEWYRSTGADARTEVAR
jgi:nucleoside-diphosphate-sugar epimerase